MVKIKQTRIDGYHKRTFPATVSCLGEDERLHFMEFRVETNPETCPLWMKCLSGMKIKVTFEGNIDH